MAEHDGATYRFASAESREAFLTNPAQFAPAYGGWCATGMSKGKYFEVDPTTFKQIALVFGIIGDIAQLSRLADVLMTFKLPNAGGLSE